MHPSFLTKNEDSAFVVIRLTVMSIAKDIKNFNSSTLAAIYKEASGLTVLHRCYDCHP